MRDADVNSEHRHPSMLMKGILVGNLSSTLLAKTEKGAFRRPLWM
jgi:hypothetical protein